MEGQEESKTKSARIACKIVIPITDDYLLTDWKEIIKILREKLADLDCDNYECVGCHYILFDNDELKRCEGECGGTICDECIVDAIPENEDEDGYTFMCSACNEKENA